MRFVSRQAQSPQGESWRINREGDTDGGSAIRSGKAVRDDSRCAGRPHLRSLSARGYCRCRLASALPGRPGGRDPSCQRGEHLGHIQRLADVVIHAGSQGFVTVTDHRIGCHRDDR